MAFTLRKNTGKTCKEGEEKLWWGQKKKKQIILK